MATRAVIRIKNTDDNTVNYRELYHHWSGYPDILGKDLQDKLNSLMKESKEYRDLVMSSPYYMEDYISDRDDNYEFYDSRIPFSQIEYLYIIDLDKKKIYCNDLTKRSSKCIIIYCAEFQENFENVRQFMDDEYKIKTTKYGTYSIKEE